MSDVNVDTPIDETPVVENESVPEVQPSEPEPEPEPVVEAAPEPEPEPVVEAAPEPEPEPVVESAPEPEPVVESAPEPEPEPVMTEKRQKQMSKLRARYGDNIPQSALDRLN